MKLLILRGLLSYWRYRPLQLLTLILGVALATALWTGVQAINAEARASYARAATVLEQNNLEQLVAAKGNGIEAETYAKLRRAGWNVSPVIEGDYRFGTVRIRLIGVDPLSMPVQGTGPQISGASDLLSFIGPPGELLVSEATANRLKDVGDLSVRISAGIPDNSAFVDIALADRLLDRDGTLSRIVIAPSQKPGLIPIETLTPELSMIDAGQEADVGRLTDSFHLNLTAFGFLSFVVGLFIVYSATGFSFEQRRSTFRTLRSLGVSLRQLTAMLLVEIVIFALVSGVIGIVLGYFIATALLPGVATTLRGLYGASLPGAISLRPEWWLAGLGMALLGTALASVQNLRQLWSMPILASAQPRAWALAASRRLAVQACIGGLLLLLSLMLAVFGHGLYAGFAVLAALLLGAALILPMLLSAVMSLGQKTSKDALAVWFWADTRQQLPGLSLALMALLLAMSTNIGVGTMVSSFRETFMGWLDQRLAADLYVTARDEAEAQRLRNWLPGRVDAILPIWSIDGEVAGREVQIFGVADDPTYRNHWPVIAGSNRVWDELASGQGALVNEQLWRAGASRIGEELELPGGWQVKVVGVYSDYGNPNGQVMIGVNAFTTHYPGAPKLRYGLRLAPEKITDVRNQLVADLGFQQGDIIDQATLKRQSAAIFEQTFKVTGALNVLTLAVAGFAMFSSLLTLSSLRLPQLAPVWAMGLRRRDLALFEIVRTLALWLTTFIIALPVGLALAWVLLSIVNVEAFGWRLPMMLFPLDWLTLGTVALIAAVLSVAIPVKRLATINPSDLLRVFSNER